MFWTDFCFFILIISGCTENVNDGELNYINNDMQFGINPPEGWSLTSEESNKVKFLSPNDPELFNAVLIIKIEDLFSSLNETQTLKDVAEKYGPIYAQFDPNLTINEIDVNGMNAYSCEFDPWHNMNLSQEAKYKYIFVEKDKRVYVLMYEAYEIGYDSYWPVVNESINTFTIL